MYLSCAPRTSAATGHAAPASGGTLHDARDRTDVSRDEWPAFQVLVGG